MNAVKHAVWLFFMIIALACSGWYFAVSSVITKLDDKTLANTPDTIITGLSVHQYTVSGSLAHFLESPLMHHIPENNTNLFDSPHIIIGQEKQPDWEIRSLKAESIERGEQITFEKRVVIHQEGNEHAQESTFKTEKLLYFPKKKFATTDLAITFEQPGSMVHSKGMEAWLEDRHVKLLHKARATYEPHHA